MFNWMQKKMNKKRKGFTLIELIVVVAILGILAAIAIPRLSGTRDGAQDAADDATARTIASAISMAEASTDGFTEKTEAEKLTIVEEYISGINIAATHSSETDTWGVVVNPLKITAPNGTVMIED